MKIRLSMILVILFLNTACGLNLADVVNETLEDKDSPKQPVGISTVGGYCGGLKTPVVKDGVYTSKSNQIEVTVSGERVTIEFKAGARFERGMLRVAPQISEVQVAERITR